MLPTASAPTPLPPVPYHQSAAAYKPNVAFFEAFGAEGWQALMDVIKLIPPEVPVLLDAKRGDISTTADAYAAALEVMCANT